MKVCCDYGLMAREWCQLDAVRYNSTQNLFVASTKMKYPKAGLYLQFDRSVSAIVHRRIKTEENKRE